MKLSQIQQLFARDTIELFQFIHSLNYSFTYGEAMRSPEQAEIYAKSGKGIADSLHCKRLAIDINIFNENGEYLEKTEQYQTFGRFWENLSPCNRWGGNFKSRKDGNHFERNDKSSK
jgi:hypothetical protein